MSVAIDEVSAEVVPPPADANPPATASTAALSPEQFARRQRELLEHLEQRAARLHAD